MSVKAVAWVLDDLQALKPGPTLVMLALADFADERNSCFPGQGRIAARARCSRRTVIRYLAELQNLGLIEVETRTANDPDGKVRRTSNRYILNVGTIMRTESDKLAHSAKPAGHTESDKLAPSVTESDKMPTECDTAVTRSPRSRSISKTPSLHPSPESDEGRPGAAAPRGAAPDGSAGVGETDSSSFESAAEAAPPVADGADNTVSGVVSASNSEDVNTPVKAETTPEKATETPLRASGVSGEERQLLTEVLPQEMQAIPPRDQSRVARAVADRVEAGWPKEAIHAALAARALPGQVKNLTALVMWRLREDVPVDGAPLSASVRKHTAQLVTSSGQAVSRRDIDAGALAMAYRQAVSAGDCSQDTSRWEFAQAVGVEHFLL